MLLPSTGPILPGTVIIVGMMLLSIVGLMSYPVSCLNMRRQDPKISRDQGIAAALGEIGPSVVLGAFTTFLGIMPMAFANSSIFRVFFRMFLTIVTFGVSQSGTNRKYS